MAAIAGRRYITNFYAEGGPIWIKFRRLAQNDMSTEVMWSKSKPEAEFQYAGRFGEFNGMSSQSHVPHCRVKEFHLPYWKSFFAVFNFFCFLNVVWALASGGFRIVSDTLVISYFGFRFTNAYKTSVLFCSSYPSTDINEIDACCYQHTPRWKFVHNTRPVVHRNISDKF